MKKNVVITGGCSGIGKATVEKFVDSNLFHVIVLDIDQNAGESMVSNDISFFKMDVSDYNDVVKVVAQIKDKFGHIHVLIHNAGISIRHKFMDITPDEWHKVIGTNLNSCFYIVSQITPLFHEGNGSILFTASTNGVMGYPYYADYNVSKAGVISLTKSLALELAPKIRVNCICPGYVMTPMQRAEYTDEMLEAVNSKLPMRRHASPDEIASGFYYLAGDSASFITGTSLVIDGGEIAGGLASR